MREDSAPKPYFDFKHDYISSASEHVQLQHQEVHTSCSISHGLLA
jgi:hypothetical protein